MKQTLIILAIIVGQLAQAQTPFTQPTASALGFSVFVRQNAYISCSDFDGAVAIGGELSIDGHTQFCNSSDGLLTDKTYKNPIGLVVNDGLLALESSDIQLGGKAWFNLGDCDRSSTAFDHQGSHAIQQIYRREDSEIRREPIMTFSTVQPLTAICKSDVVNFQQQFQDLEALSSGMSACAENIKNRLNVDHENGKVLTLMPNRVNVWNVDIQTLNTIYTISFENRPSIITPLVINVRGDGKEHAIDFPDLHSIQNTEGLYMIWNFINIPQLKINLTHPAIGTLFAPATILKIEGEGNVEGQIIAKSVDLQHVVVRDRPFSTFVGTCSGSNADIRSETAQVNTYTLNETIVVKLYPNPSSDYINIYATQLVSNFQIYNQLGQIVLSDKYTGEPISIRRLPEGYYMVEVLDTNNMRMSLLGFQKID